MSIIKEETWPFERHYEVMSKIISVNPRDTKLMQNYIPANDSNPEY